MFLEQPEIYCHYSIQLTLITEVLVDDLCTNIDDRPTNSKPH